jgi:hypothetical protein
VSLGPTRLPVQNVSGPLPYEESSKSMKVASHLHVVLSDIYVPSVLPIHDVRAVSPCSYKHKSAVAHLETSFTNSCYCI